MPSSKALVLIMMWQRCCCMDMMIIFITPILHSSALWDLTTLNYISYRVKYAQVPTFVKEPGIMSPQPVKNAILLAKDALIVTQIANNVQLTNTIVIWNM